LAAGQYTVVVVNNNTGCETQPYIVNIGTTPDRPDFTPVAVGSPGTANNTICNPDLATTDYSGEITVNPNTGTIAGFNYQWYEGSTATAGNEVTTTSIPGSAGQTSNHLQNVPGGSYTVRITSGTNACDTTITVTITDA